MNEIIFSVYDENLIINWKLIAQQNEKEDVEYREIGQGGPFVNGFSEGMGWNIVDTSRIRYFSFKIKNNPILRTG